MLFAAIISMAISPFLIRYNGKLTEKFCNLRPSDQDFAIIQDLEHEAEGMDQHVIICGYGRIGQNLGRLLDHEGFPYVALDLDPTVVREAHEADVPVLVRTKDDTHLEELEAAGAAEVMPEAVEASLMMGGSSCCY